MTRFDTTTHSDDDDFDLVNDTESVSELSVHDVPSHGAQRLSGPHEIPTLPHMQDDDCITELNDQYAGLTTHGANPSLATVQRGSSSAKDRINTGLQYTKSIYKQLWSRDALIAVMGMTGSGKTTFISKATGRDDLRIGHDLTSCTRDIQVVETKIDGQTVRFVDTPGFSDTNLSDTEVLEMIADYLAAAYKQEMKLTGIIYVHPISDTRVTHHTIKNLDMFRKLTGEDNLENVIFATSMWDRVPEHEGAKREQELKGKFWRLLITLGAKTIRHNDTAGSAQSIARILLQNKKPFYLQLQEEMGKGNMPLRDTAAGREVVRELEKMKAEHQREISEMENLIKNSAKANEDIVQAMREHYQDRLSELEKTLRDERRLNEEAVRSLNDRVQELESRKGGCNVM